MIETGDINKTGGEKKRRILFAKILVIAVSLIIVLAAAMFVKLNHEQSKMQIIETQEIIPGIFAVSNDSVNFFLIKTGDKYIAIDAGANKGKTEKELKKLGISSDDVAGVYLTHSHYDHIGALSLFRNAIFFTGNEKLPKRVKIPVHHQILPDGGISELYEVTVEIIYTPGHTENSVCYLIDGKYLFVGDNLSLKDNKIGLFNSFFNKDNDVQGASIQKLSNIEGVQYIFSSHYGFTDNAVFP